MIRSVVEFVNYFNGVRKRTLTYVHVLPADKIDWHPRSGEFTCGDLIRHLSAAEKMFVGLALNGVWKYEGHEGAQTYEALLTELEQTHVAAMTALKTLPEAELDQPRPALTGTLSLKTWRWLMALAEHEIHHRSQLAMYLFLLEITPPHIYGLGVEEVIAQATG
jgi:uncharacterized damage-inducible protein DinB